MNRACYTHGNKVMQNVEESLTGRVHALGGQPYNWEQATILTMDASSEICCEGVNCTQLVCESVANIYEQGDEHWGLLLETRK